jgi:hypothetical protein
MKKVLVLVEGQTEEIFVKQVLGEWYISRDISLIPKIITTKRVKAGTDFKGGIVSYEKVRKEVLRLLGDSSAGLVTTMFDYYGLPDNFPGRNIRAETPHERAAAVEDAFNRDIASGRFSSFIVLHEFEGLLFSSPRAIVQAMQGPEKEPALRRIRASFTTPEDIDDGLETAPSKRICKEFPQYEKILHGSIIAGRIGLEAIRHECPHFNEWLNRIERL